MKSIELHNNGKSKKISLKCLIWQPFLMPIVGLLLLGCLLVGCTVKADYVEPTFDSGYGPQDLSIDLSAYQSVRYVSAELGSDNKGNGSKANPWKSILYAINKMNGREAMRSAILVSEGAYAVTKAIAMKPYVNLYGGFNAKNWNRNIYKYRSIIDGKNSNRLIIASNHSVLDGFTLTHGSVRGKGGGILAEGVSPIIRNNIFVKNKTLKPHDWQPKFWHNTANDGGAIACLNGCSATVKNNLFIQNNTGIGRGGGFACDNEATKDKDSAPELSKNIFVNNITSVDKDSMRSGDGGGISFYGYCKGIIKDNIVTENEASSKNDGGGIFIALWSAPDIIGNIVVGNKSGDDGGGVFIGGQKHHYETPKDPVPESEEYFVKFNRNIVIGNRNGSPTSGAIRATMMSRAVFGQNIFAHNPGGVYGQRSELTFKKNVFLDDVSYVDDKNQAPGPTILANNIMLKDRDWQAKVVERRNHYKNVSISDSGFIIKSNNIKFKPHFYTTTVQLSNKYKPGALTNRIIQADKRWTVILSNDEKSMRISGNFENINLFKVKPSYSIPN